MTAPACAATDHEAITDAIGARVLLDKPALLSGRHARRLRQLLEERGVLVFPRVGFSEREQIAFTRTLGTYVPDTPDGAATPISIEPAAGRSADYTKASFFWHFDGYMNDNPILGSLLCCETPAPAGGQTSSPTPMPRGRRCPPTASGRSTD